MTAAGTLAARCELAIIGAGVVGCALAREFAPRTSSLLVLEADAREGTGISSRNSGVVHAGLYYPPGSRRALSCVAGNARLWRWVEARGVPHRRTGKLVVAVNEAERSALAGLERNARASGATVEVIGPARAAVLEPELPVAVQAALWSPNSGIVDAHELTRSLLVDAEARGAQFVFAAPVSAVTPASDGLRLDTPRGTVIAERVINAAGLGAVDLARRCGATTFQQFPARGDYFRLRRHAPWRRLIYPVRLPDTPSLGIHLTLELDGSCRLGPDLDWVDDPTDFSPARGEAKRRRFWAAARRLLGPLAEDQLLYDGCGIRPKLSGPDQPTQDFVVHQQPEGVWHLLGIESPGLTASMALASELAALLS